MNKKTKAIIRNFSYSLSSNIISLLISTLVVLIVPKLIGVTEYGYWQLYLFYSSYVGFLHLGWVSGLYLKIGGEKYQELDKKNIAEQFRALIILQVIFAFIIITFVSVMNNDINKEYIFYMVAICAVLTNSRDMISFVFQATNRIKDYALIISVGRLLYFIIILIFLIVGIRDYKLMILGDLTGRFVSLLFAIYKAKDMVFIKIETYRFNIKEILNNISIGSKLMLSNLASMLIIGIVRLGIEYVWDVDTFGKVSLTLSASNLMMLFINAIGIIVFPLLRRTAEKKLSTIYFLMRNTLMVISMFLLIGYYPLKLVLSSWLPKYSESLMYMALIFPMFIYEGKMALLVNSYLKNFRKEKLMLRINMISVIISAVVTVFATIILKNLSIAIMSILVLLAIRCILAETCLAKILNIRIRKDMILELLLTIIFVISAWYINSWFTVLIYGLSYLLYLMIKKKDIKNTVVDIKKMIKNEA